MMPVEVHAIRTGLTRPRSGWRDVLGLAAFIVAYFLLAYFGYLLMFKPHEFVTFWPPSGLFVATLLLTKRRSWPRIIIAALITDFVFELTHNQQLITAAGYSFANMAEACIGAMLVQRFSGSQARLQSVREVTVLVICSALVSTAIGAFIGGSLAFHAYQSMPYWTAWFSWWSGDAMGVLLVAPVILAWQPRNGPWRWLVKPAVASTYGVLLLCTAVFLWLEYGATTFPFSNRKFLLIPLMLFTALQYGMKGASLYSLFVGIIATFITMHAVGTAPGIYQMEAMIWLNLFLLAFACTGLFQAALLNERQQQTRELEVAEQKYRGIVENAIVGIFRFAPGGVLISANKAALEMFGYASFENAVRGFISDRFGLFADPNDRIEALRILEIEGRLGPRRYTMRRCNGSLMQAVITACVIRDPAGATICFDGTCIDVTESARAEAALRLSEEKYRTLIETTDTGYVIVDELGKVVDANQRYLRLIGRNRLSDIAGHSVLEWTSSNAKATNLKAIKTCLAQGYVHNHETEYVTADGNTLPIEINATVVRDGAALTILAMCRDITERKTADEALRRSEASLNRIFDSSPYPQWISNAEGIMIKQNQACRDILHVTDDEIVGKYCIFNDDIAERQGLMPTIREAFALGESRTIRIRYDTSELQHLDFEHKVSIIVETTITPVLDDHGNVVNAVVQLFDITERLRAEEALRESEQKFRDISEKSIVGIYVIQDNRIIYANSMLAQIFGYSVDEITNDRGPQDFVHPDDWQLVAENIEKRFTGAEQAMHYEFRILTKDQRIVFVEVYSSRTYYQGKQSIIGTMVDITARKEAEAALLRSDAELRRTQRFMQMILDTSPAYIVAIDSNGKTLTMNRALLDALEYTLDEVVGMDYLYHFVPESERAQVDGVFNKIINDKIGTVDINSIISKSGKVYLVEWHGRNVVEESSGFGFFVGVGIDIAERRQAEEALFESFKELQRASDRYQALIGASNTGAWEYHNDTGFMWCSPEYFTMLGRDIADYDMSGARNIEQVLTELLHPEDRDEAMHRFNEYLLHPEGMFEQHFRMLHSDGRNIWIWSRGKTISDFSGRSANITVGTHIDVTEREHAAEENRRLQEQLAQAQKMEAVGRLAGGVAHDFNNMLGVIIGSAELALEQVDTGSEVVKQIQEILDASHRSADLTKQLLAFARKQATMPKVLDLNSVVAETMKILIRLIGEDIKLEWTPGKDLWRVRIDPAQVTQVLTNLTVNARDAISGEGGRIKISTSNAELDETCGVFNYRFAPGDYVQLEVEDNGIGMSPESITNIFEPFYTTKALGQGTGLGLSTVYGIVQQNHGMISVYSEPQQGTSFKIYLPRYTGEDYSVSEEADMNTCGGQEIILLVEDEPAILNMARTMLERLGYCVLAAESPGEAIRLAEEHAGEIHLLMTDVVMPEMNGRDLAGRLLSLYPNLRRLFMSGYTADVITHHGVLDEGIHFIQKPFSKKDLAQKVREALGNGIETAAD